MDEVKQGRHHYTDLLADFEIEVKAEFANVYEIEETAFVYDDASDEEKREITEFNDKFEEKHIKPFLIDLVKNSPSMCTRQGPRLIQRWNKERKLNFNMILGKWVGRISQKDFDSYKWDILIDAKEGRDQGLAVVMRQCLRCNRVEMFGDTSLVMLQLCKMHMNNLDARLKAGEYVVEDLETGEISPASDAVQSLIEGDGDIA